MKTGQFHPLAIVVQDNFDGTWTLRDPLAYVSAAGERIEIPAGFITDFGSIPAMYVPFGLIDIVFGVIFLLTYAPLKKLKAGAAA